MNSSTNKFTGEFRSSNSTSDAPMSEVQRDDATCTDFPYSEILNYDWPDIDNQNKMPLHQRAKIFLPFAALKGFEEELEKRKEIIETNLQTVYCPD